MRQAAENLEAEHRIHRYLQRRGLACAVISQVPRQPRPAPEVLTWVWMAALYAAGTLALALAIWEVL